MQSRTAHSKGATAFWMAFLLVISLVFPTGAALASHTNANTSLNVEPETATRVTGTTHTMSATISRAAPEHSVFIDAEIQSGGPNDQDGTTYGTPDLGCFVPAGALECILSYTGTNTGTDTIRAWIDYDNNDTTVEADQNEAREERVDPDETPEDPTDDDPFARGTGCPSPGTSPTASPPTPTLLNQAAEPDCTDVVSVTWTTGVQATPTFLDCDDSGGSDTEREVNPHNAGDASNETYTCTVRDQSGAQMGSPPADRAVEVKAEVENGVNDPDLTDGASYDRPDYTCITARPATAAPTSTTRNCTITVTQNEGEQGKAIICFWVGDAPTGANLCANEETGEGQSQTPPFGGDGTGNDLADKVEKAWHLHELNCEPETDTNPTGTSHEITCTVLEVESDPVTGRARVGGARVDVEASGANDPQGDGDTTQSRRTPDFTCTTAVEDDPATPTTNEEGTCVIRHGPGGTGSTTSTGTTLYRAWIDVDNNDNTDESDAAEGRDESTQPGNDLEPDDTDVVQKAWSAAPTALTITPESDTATVGSCNAYTITATSSGNTPAQGATIDVEQRHERAQNSTQNDEPRVSFCQPGEGPNPSQVDEGRGDLRPPDESPDNVGTAGGETTTPTDSQGRVTIGIQVAPANGSDGTGRVDIVAFFETTDNDDPDSGEPQDTATKTWVGSQARTIACSPDTASNTVGTQHVVTCTVRNQSGQPAAGEGVTFTETGPGTVSPTAATTNQNGQATTTATSSEAGQQTITGTITASTQGEPDTDECERAAGDPQGAPAGNCSDSVTKTWVASTARTIDCEPETDTNEVGTSHTVTCTVRNAAGQTVAGEGVTFTETGPGSVSPAQATTNQNGQASTTATSTTAGTQSITGTLTVDTQGEPDTDECDRAAGDPSGAPAGVCEDSVEKTWTGTAPECSDGIDNDGDGLIDFPDDPGCTSAQDDDERDEVPRACRNRGSGENVIVGTSGPDTIQGTSGRDIICGAGGDDVINGRGGSDLIAGNGGDDTIAGGRGKDNVSGNAGDDTVSGNRGNDAVKGQGGSDTLKGNKGIDTLTGGGGNDTLQGGNHQDVLKGGRGNDTLRGGKGDDALDGGPGNDQCFGGPGDDSVRRCE